VEDQKVLHILSVCLRPSLSNMHSAAPYYIVICGLPDSTVFSTLSQKKGTIFGKKII